MHGIFFTKSKLEIWKLIFNLIDKKFANYFKFMTCHEFVYVHLQLYNKLHTLAHHVQS
jgi:hypothetical protein